MSHQAKYLYESPLIWDQALQLGQKNVVAAIGDFFPPGMKRVLDVGCGDGKVTSALIQRLEQPIVGLDFSDEALSRCSFEIVQGDAGNLPFPDQNFDLVFSVDMFEHLPSALAEQAWQQLFRVAAKAVVVVVPFREDLLLATARCGACGHKYHVNWHMRAYDFADLAAKAPPGWVVDKIILSGEPWPPFSGWETQFRRHLLDEWAGWAGAFCPDCATPGQDAMVPTVLEGLTAAALGTMIYADAEHTQDTRSHSEIIVLYRHQSQASWPVEVPPPQLVEVRSSSRVRIPADGIFNNLQPYPLYARSVHAVGGGVVVQLPVYDNPAVLILSADEITTTTQVDFVLEDGIGVVCSGPIQIEGGRETRLMLPRPLVTGYHGVLLRLPKETPALTVSLDDPIRGRRILPGDKEYCYLKEDRFFEEASLYLQVTEPLWIGDRYFAGGKVKPHCNGPAFFKQINALSQRLMDSVPAPSSNKALSLANTEAALAEMTARWIDADATLKTLWGRREMRVGEQLRRLIGKSLMGKKKL